MKSDEKETYSRLALYQDDLLSSNDRETVEAHLRENEETRARLENLRQLDESLHLLGQKDRVFQKVESNLKRIKRRPNADKRIAFPIFSYRYLAAGTTFAVFLIAFWFTFARSPQVELLIQAGDVNWAKSDAPSQAPKIGDCIRSGEDAFAMLRMADGGSIIEIGPQTDVSLLEARKISIERGVVYHHVSKNPNSPFQAITPFGTITVLGTVFEIEVGARQAWVRVKEGKVRLSPADPPNSTNIDRIVQAGFESFLQRKSASLPSKIATGSIAPWRAKFQSSNLDVHNIAKIISDSKKK